MSVRRLSTVVVALFAVLFVPASAGEVTLRFSWWGGSERHEATLKAIELFEKANPGVTIKGEYMGWNGYLERLTTQIGGGSEADIMQIDWAWLAVFSKNGDGFFDLTSKPGLVDAGAYDKKWLDQTTVKGKLNGLPVSFTTQYFMWNKTVFDKAGAPIPKTWEDIVEGGKILKEKLGNEYYAMDTTRTQAMYMTHSYIFQKTGKMFVDPATGGVGLSVDEMEDWLSFYHKLTDSHGLTSLQARASRSGDSDSAIQEQPEFVEGHWAGAWNWDSSLHLTLATPKKEFSFVMGDFPTQPGAKTSGRIGRPAQVMVVSKNSKHPEVAAKFVNFLLTSPEAARILKVTRGVLLSKPSYEALDKDNLITPIQQQAVAQLKGVETYNPHPYFEDPRTLKLLGEVFEEVGFGKITPRQGAERLATDGAQVLKRLAR